MNANQGFREYSPWGPSSSERRERERQARWDGWKRAGHERDGE
jgi:hypothetical protein